MTYRSEREEICNVCHLLWQNGWVAANDGNVSVRLSDGNILVTPTGVSKRLITPEMLVVADMNGNIIEGDRKYSSEFKMHLCCYRERSDAGAVLHAHPATATGFAVAHKALDDYSMIETVIAIGSVPVTPFGTPSTEEVPDAIRPYLQDHDVLLLANHGALTLGCDLMTAYYRMETLELFAKISLTAHMLGGAVELPRENTDRLISMREQYKVTGRHPGYRKYPEGDR
ncbi:MAG: class II aldolase/adducin family protein [Bullifex sp.]